MSFRATTTGILLLVTIASALGVVYSQHQSRALFVELQEQMQQIDEQNIYWGRLLLEQSTWATHGRVESIARESLGMHMPAVPEIEVVGQ